MPVTVVVGGQYGSEGKGKVAFEFCRRGEVAAAVRVGGANSGHTVVTDSGRFILRHLPTAALLPSTLCIIPAGSYIDPEVLLEEVALTKLPPERLIVDSQAAVITERHKEAERRSDLRQQIGSTESGTGAAVIARLQRDGGGTFARHIPALEPFVKPVAGVLRQILNSGQRVLIEGTQGFGLSPLHSPHYPFVTSRDTTAASFVAEAGLSPRDVDQVVLTIRSFPIRVGGSSGPLEPATTWEEITRQSGSLEPILERTSVTGTVRRVAQFDPEIVKASIVHNNPTQVVLNHLDYIDRNCFTGETITARALAFIEQTAASIGRQIDFVGVTPAKLIAIS